MRRALLVFVALVSIPPAASPQPVGPEFRANTFTTNYQFRAAVASDGPGDFVIVWDSAEQDGSILGVFGQRYDSSGAPEGPEFLVNTYTTGPQGLASVAYDGSSNFVVAWTSLQDGSSYGVYGKRYASTGAPLGAEFRVNTHTTGAQGFPAVAVDTTGSFVVVWESYQDGSVYGIFGQRYASTGTRVGPEFRINTFTTGSQYNPAVATSASGSFVVVWSSPQDGSGDGVFGQKFANSGAPIGPEFRVNTYTPGRQYRPAVASDTAGNFVVVWTGQLQDGSGNGVFGQRYAASGNPLGPEFRVNTYTTDNQSAPSVALDSTGFVVVWDSAGQDGSSNGVFAQQYLDTGTPLGIEFRVNSYTTDLQFRPAVATDASGRFVVAWTSNAQDGSGYGVFGHRFGQGAAVALSVSDVTVTEGDAGTVNAVFTVTLPVVVAETVTVQYATADDTAVAGADYTAATGTLTFPRGTMSQPVSVPVLGDVLDEDDETFTLNLSNPTNATIDDGQGIGTIIDNDPLPSIFAGDCTVTEGQSGPTPCAFTVMLAPVSGRTVTVGYATADDTATAGSDYTAANGTLTIPAGATGQIVNVDVLGDTATEPTEAFFLNLSAPSNAVLADAQAVGTILDDDIISLSNVEVSHGSDLTADFAGGTPDLYRLSQLPLSSWEILLDSLSGDAVPGLLLERLAADNVTVVQAAIPVGTGSALSLRWENTVAGTVNGEHIRLRSPACGTGCGTDDIYRLRVYETSLAVTRFNNAGSQITVVVVQNATSQAVSGHIHFWSLSGALLLSEPLTLAARATLVRNSATHPLLQGQGGSVTVAHDGPYGAVVGKTVALEPATGFSFDSPLQPRSR